MKKYVGLFVLVVVMIALSSVFVMAQGLDDAGNPNDPTVNASANECYEGGVMEGKCDTEIEWVAGWYLIKYRYNLIDTVPGWVAWALPENYIAEVAVDGPTSPTGPTPPGCIGPVTLADRNGQSGANKYILFDAGPVEDGTDPYNSPGCVEGDEWFTILNLLVYAPNGQSEANTLCNGTGNPIGSDVYKCI